MGAWDVGIFDNDTSEDVRGIYEDARRGRGLVLGERVLVGGADVGRRVVVEDADVPGAHQSRAAR